MKKIILALIVCISVSQFSSAQNVSDTLPKSSDRNQNQIYLEKSHNQKSAAITLLVIGGTTMIIGAIGTAANALNEQGNSYAIVFLAGTTVSLCSIPLFIASHRNKNKAVHSASLQLESVPLSSLLPSGGRAIGFGIEINF